MPERKFFKEQKKKNAIAMDNYGPSNELMLLLKKNRTVCNFWSK